MDWVDAFFTSKSVLVYVCTGEIALIFTVLARTVAAKRMANGYDFYEILVFSLFVFVAVILADFSPGLSFVIGLASREIWLYLQSRFQRFAPMLARTIIPLLKEDKEPAALPPAPPLEKEGDPV